MSDSENEEPVRKSKKTELSACLLLNKDVPDYVSKIFGKLDSPTDGSKQGSIDISDRVIRLLKGALLNSL